MSNTYTQAEPRARDAELSKWEVIVFAASTSGLTTEELAKVISTCHNVSELASAISGYNLVRLAVSPKGYGE